MMTELRYGKGEKFIACSEKIYICKILLYYELLTGIIKNEENAFGDL